MENRSCVRWYQINPSLGTRMQEGNYGSPGSYYFYPAIAPDASQNAVIVFNRSSSSEFASTYYTGRRNSHTLNLLQASVRLRAGQGCYVKLVEERNRWGDYSGISIDPSNNNTWIMSEYAVGTSTNCAANTWRTAIGQTKWQ
jgi:hypothetical protein